MPCSTQRSASSSPCITPPYFRKTSINLPSIDSGDSVVTFVGLATTRLFSTIPRPLASTKAAKTFCGGAIVSRLDLLTARRSSAMLKRGLTPNTFALRLKRRLREASFKKSQFLSSSSQAIPGVTSRTFRRILAFSSPIFRADAIASIFEHPSSDVRLRTTCINRRIRSSSS